MRHFLHIAENVDVIPLLHSLAQNPDLWNENSLRTEYPESPHHEADDIWVWFNKQHDNPADTVDDIQTVPYRAWDALKPIRPLVFDLMRRVEGVQLGRVIISRLPPGGVIAPHKDEGAPASFYTRYQLALQSGPGCLFHIEDETVNFRSGDLYWIDNRSTHSVVNNSSDDRIALVMDVRLA